MKKLLKEFIKECVNFNNVKMLFITVFITFLLSKNKVYSLYAGVIYISILILIWSGIKILENERKKNKS